MEVEEAPLSPLNDVDVFIPEVVPEDADDEKLHSSPVKPESSKTVTTHRIQPRSFLSVSNEKKEGGEDEEDEDDDRRSSEVSTVDQVVFVICWLIIPPLIGEWSHRT